LRADRIASARGDCRADAGRGLGRIAEGRELERCGISVHEINCAHGEENNKAEQFSHEQIWQKT
jgi:hypothetical protein